MEREGKKAQVTIFIIVAILVVAIVIVYFLYIQPTYFAAQGKRLGFENCAADVVEGEIGSLGERAGFVNPGFSYLYQDEEIPYLCYAGLYYKPCIIQKPFLKQHFESELKKAVVEKIEKCYNDNLNDLKRQGYDVVSGGIDFDISLEPGKVRVDIDAPTTISKQTSQRFVEFGAEVNSQIYDMLMLATSILQYESKYGDSDTAVLMTLYPNFAIDKIVRGDSTKIYIIEDKKTGTKFKFASRSFAMPAGYGIDTGLVGA